MKISFSIVIVVLCVIASIPAFTQLVTRPLFFQFSYGQSFFRSNSLPGYTYVCPEVKLGLGITKEKNRFGVSTAVLIGIRYGATRKLPYQMFISESRLYMQLQERYYSSAFEFMETPITMHYKLVDDKLSIHAGLSARWYLNENFVIPAFQRYLEDIPIDRFNMGILTMLKFTATPRIGASIDYSFGLKKLNIARSLQHDMTHHINGSFAQVSLYFNFLNKGKRE